ncbi:MAG TPA: MFS transporter [Terriglobales bacterium]|nr:MFS transporter [Terriglobales bacterium]
MEREPEIPGLGRPLRNPTFRNLLIADVVSDVGAFMQSTGAAWLMVPLNAGPLYVALTQTASALPFFIFALPAGAIGDIVDRRKLILFTETWMAGVAVVLAALTLSGSISPLPLLILTFALSAGDAFETPTWRAVLPDVVAREDLPAASALNGIEFNFARAIGPGLAGLLIAAAGVGSAFLLNAVSFVGVILVIARWKRPLRKRTAPPETLMGATVAAIRYVHYSPPIRTLLARSGLVMFFASGLLALLPSLAHTVKNSPVAYGILLGCFGLGAVLGAVLMQRVRARWSTEAVVAGGVAIFGISTIAASALHSLPALALAMVFAGSAWIIFISLVSVLVLNHAPDWVRARVLAVSTLVFQGAVAAGSVIWGAVASRAGISTALLSAGAGTVAMTSLALFLRLPDAKVDLTSWNHWRLPVVKNGAETVDDDLGPVLVTVEYEVAPEQVSDFLQALRQYRRIRRRDGARRWGVFRDLENAGRYVETFIVGSWAEHLRQHERFTRADRELEERVQRYVTSTPKVRHLISVE